MDFSAIDVEDLLKYLDLGEARLTSGGTEAHFPCFGAEHSDGGAAYMNVETKLWICHGCKRRGNPVTLVMEVQQVTRATAESQLREWFGIQFDEPIGGSMAAEIEARFRPVEVKHEPTRPPASWLIGVRVDWYLAKQDPQPHESYMFGRGFTPATLKEWDVGYDYLSDRITIPVFDVDGELVGVKGRGWREDQEPKYLILGDRQVPRYGFEPYDSSQVVFGLHRNRHVRTVVLVEGEFNAEALTQIGVERPAATGMSYFSDRHAQLIAREADEVVVYYDYGAAGYQGVWGNQAASGAFRPGVVQKLEPYVRVRVVDPTPEDPAKLVELGRGDEAIQLIAAAQSTLALPATFG